MKNRMRLALVLSGVLLISACSGFEGERDPNQPPDTEVTAGPPALEQSSFSVEFFWKGSDTDGWVDHYEWRISDNGPDGIVDIEDTLGLPWHATVATDSVFEVKADLDSFQNDVDNPDLTDPKDFRYWQTHTFFVRSIDEKGGVDPSPATVSFTATTIAPTINITKPAYRVTNSCISSARGLTFGWEGVDPDNTVPDPAAVRYALVNVTDVHVPGKPPLETGACLTTDQYNALNPVPYFRDEDWSDWIPYDAAEDSGRVVTFPVKDFGESFFFAVQAKDVAGAVTPTFQWGKNLRHVKITPGKYPALRVTEKFLGSALFTGPNAIKGFEIVAGQPLEFSWEATGEAYAGIIEAYRYGWQIQDVNDDEDPGWAVSWGKGANFLRAPIRTFQQGSPNFVVQVRDNSGSITRGTYQFEVIQITPRAKQYDLLFIDDFGLGDTDWELAISARWREMWQSMLVGRVVNFEPTVDYIDCFTQGLLVNFRLLNEYKSVIWFTNGNNATTVFNALLRPSPGFAKYNWLEVYQAKVGNILFVGPAVTRGMVEDLVLNMPLIYTSEDAPPDGLGCERQFDDSCVPYGTMRWSFTGWCLETSDVVRPPAGGRFGEDIGGEKTTTLRCDYLFRAEVSQDFLSQFPSANGVVEDLQPDCTSPRIPDANGSPQELGYYKFDWEEFYNKNVAPEKQVTISPRECQLPMFVHRAARDNVYPPDCPNAGEPIIAGADSLCEPYGKENSPIDGASVAIVSSVYSDSKQLPGSNDFLWGFHPLAFRLDRVQAALLWIIEQNWDIDVIN